jgi:ABC-type sugar transport system ATPase subunit
VSVDGRPVRPTALGSRVSLVAADRAASLFSNLSVEENLVIRLDSEISRGVLGLRSRRMRAIAQELRDSFHVKSAGLDVGVRSLSGGNQQKVAIAAAIASGPRVLLLEEPTRGVDLGSRQEIYRLLRGLAQTGCAVLIFCTETTEVFDAAARVQVVSRGRLLPEIDVNHQHVEALAAELTRLELAAPASPTAARPASKEGSER